MAISSGPTNDDMTISATNIDRPNVSNQPSIDITIGKDDQQQAASRTQTMEQEDDRRDFDEDAMIVDSVKDDSDGPEDGTEQGDAGSTSRKKKGQRFFCTGYPPCNLSFTRSEHLARHIRKHTGERPFQCHCNRRFSRLDNLRQHAQTVHVNEEIPTDSLAATGTRFQRQIRTDRVRPTGRPRTNTMSSTGSHSRGHSRNLSTSSIGSIASTTSNYSTTDPRRRPPPLLMATDSSGRPKLGIDPPSTPPPQFASYATNSPGDITTPTSTFSATPGSPNFGSTIGSPLSSASRIGTFLGGTRTPGRRLSVPAAPPPYHSQYGPAYGSPYSNQSGPAGSFGSPNTSTIASPTASTFSYVSGFNVPTGEDWRRRTWHPSSYSNANFNYARPATSGLTYSQTPDAPQPAFAQNATAAAGQAPRLPGIESFDHVQQRPTTPPRHNANSSVANVSKQPTLMPAPDIEGQSNQQRPGVDTKPTRYSEIDDTGRSSAVWVQETIEQIQQLQQVKNDRENHLVRHAMGPPAAAHSSQQNVTYETSQPQPAGSRAKRGVWYSGPGPAVRTSPEDSSSSEGVPTPGTSVADVQPAIMHSNGLIEAQHHILPADAHQSVSRGSQRH